MHETPLRIALLSYRSHPEVGGQGVYVRSLSRALAERGHKVTVFSGQPYPVLDPPVQLRCVPSLDLYRQDDPFRRPKRSEFRGTIDVLEYGAMCTGSFPEPLTFSLRVANALLVEAENFDVVHDNQTLGYGLLRIARRLPLVTTVHHPISIDRRLALADATDRKRRIGLRRWYSFVRMQARVARLLPSIVSVSTSSRDELIADFGVSPERIAVIPNGVDTDLFRPLDLEREPGHIVTIASSDQPSKGLDQLVEAVAKLATERQVRLSVVGKGGLGRSFRKAVARFGIGGLVTATGRVSGLDLVDVLNRAEVAVVPSLYEGFSLPAVEAMAAGTPLVATTGGALPEVVGEAGLLVRPGDAGALAQAISALLDDPARRQELSRKGRNRAERDCSWHSTAADLVEHYRRVIASC